jgi:proteasome lid subunit RPN8/RPN11
MFLFLRGTFRGTARTAKKAAPVAGRVALAYTGAGSGAAAVAARLPDSKYKAKTAPTAAQGTGMIIDNHSHTEPWPAIIDIVRDAKGGISAVVVCANDIGPARQKVLGAAQGHRFGEPTVKKCANGNDRHNYRFPVRR